MFRCFLWLYITITKGYIMLRRRMGKTLLAKTLARFVNVPFVIADATTLTQVNQNTFTQI
ncbi:putative Clp protease, ATP-binding subunit ClpX, P-loop containing nucleoside triphosphate hydrolase [Helianthus anomalus]